MVLVSAAVLLPFGRLADAYGRMRFFIGSMVLFSVVSFASALAPSAAVLLALRMLIGISLAIGSVTAPALVILAFPIEVRGRALGWNVLGVYLGVTVGPFLGGLIFHGIGWRGFFYVLAGVNLINVILPVWKLRHIEWKEPKQGRFDVAGSLLYAAGSGGASARVLVAARDHGGDPPPGRSAGAGRPSCGGNRARPILCCPSVCSSGTGCSRSPTAPCSSTTPPPRP